SPLYAVYKSTSEVYAPFVALPLRDDNTVTHYLRPLVTKGAKNTINVSDVGALDGTMSIPAKLEQQSVVKLFRPLDSLIQSEEQKLEQLQSLKKSFLQKMFPKKGTTVPELRFDGFSGDWVEKKLEDVFKRVSVKGRTDL